MNQSKITPKQRAAEIVARLEAFYPDVHCTLDFQNPHQLLVGAILAAQCTDARVNLITPALFARYPEPADYAAAERTELEELIRSCGLFRNKAKAIQAASQAIVDRFNGEMPATLEDLVSLPGVGRKTAERLVVEMKDRLAGWSEGALFTPHTDAVSVAQANQAPDGVEEEAISALLALGYKPQQASVAVSRVFKPEMKVEAVIRDALRSMIQVPGND